MKIVTRTLPLLGLILMVLNGCNRGGDMKSGVSKLKEAFPTASAAVPAAADNSAESATKQVDVNVYVGQAVSSLQNNDHVGAVTLLNTVQKQTGLTAQQRIAVQETINKVYADLVARIARGDPKAKAAIVELEKTYSQ
jgi:hypothetical protein